MREVLRHGCLANALRMRPDSNSQVYLNQWYPTLSWMPLNAGLRTPKLALEMCDHRQPTSRDWCFLVDTAMPPPVLTVKLNEEVFPGGRSELVISAPPASSIKGDIRPRW